MCPARDPSRQAVSAPGAGSSCEPSRRVTSSLRLAPRGPLLCPTDSVSDGRRHCGLSVEAAPWAAPASPSTGLTRGQPPLSVHASLDTATLPGVTWSPHRGAQPAAATWGPPGRGNQGSGGLGPPRVKATGTRWACRQCSPLNPGRLPSQKRLPVSQGCRVEELYGWVVLGGL